MESTKSRLHPLLTAAAISVTVFSAVGVASLTGLIPQSVGSQKQEIAAAPLAPAPEAAKPVDAAPAPAEPAVTPAPAPAPKPVKKAVRHVAPRKSEPVAYSNVPPPPPVAQAPAQIEAPKPVVQAGLFGTVQSVREVSQPGQHTALGPIAGGVAGAIVGNQFGHGTGKQIMTVLGAAGGAFAGREIEQQARATKHWEIDVRLDNGTQRTVASDAAPQFNAGDRVRIVDGRLQPV